MNRNVESRFALAPNVNIPRSVNDSSFKVKTTWNVGQLVPLMWDEILPGQSVRLKLNSVVRMQPMVTSPLDDLYFDTYAFFIPYRLLMTHWPELCGQNTTAPWVQTNEYKVPQLYVQRNVGQSDKFIKNNGILSYLGVPTNKIPEGGKLSFSALPRYGKAGQHRSLRIRGFLSRIPSPITSEGADGSLRLSGWQKQ